MYKVVTITNSGEKVEIKEFDNKNEAYAVYMKAVSEQYENIAKLRALGLERKSEAIIRGDLIFSREYYETNIYILLIGEDLRENKRAGKYKQILKRYKNLL